MKRIELPQGFANVMAGVPHEGKGVCTVVAVDWFPRLTEQQIFENAIALADGRPSPHPDQNIIEVFCPWPDPRPRF